MGVLSIQSAVAYGHVGNSAAVFILQRLGHEVWPVDTVVFSNHPAYPSWRGRVVPAEEVAELILGVGERGAFAHCDAVLSGYLGDPATAEVVLDAVERVKTANSGALYCCDPVMGEAGKGVYVHRDLPRLFRERLVPRADVVTPNPLELEALTGASVTTLEGALAAADALRRLGPALVVATGLVLAGRPGMRAVLAVDRAGAWLVESPEREVAAHGAGDAFTALFLGVYLRERDVAAALAHAVGATDGILSVTQRSGALDLCLVAAQDVIARPVGFPPARRLR